MALNHKTLALIGGKTTRMDDLMTLFGCENKIAKVDSSAFGRRAGALIARAASSPKPTKSRSTTVHSNRVATDTLVDWTARKRGRA